MPRENSPPSNGSVDLSLLKTWNAKSLTSIEDCLPHRFRAVACQRPLAPAVRSWDRNLDYCQLDALSDFLAHKILSENGVGVETIIPLACEKAASTIVALLAISKTDGAFLPPDISHSKERL